MLQRLWSGYGSIVRYALEGAAQASVIVKHVSPPSAVFHPRGWNTDSSHARKLHFYEVKVSSVKVAIETKKSGDPPKRIAVKWRDRRDLFRGAQRRQDRARSEPDHSRE
jgi:hypothetical protein